MTIYEYLNTLNADYTASPPVPLIWTKSDVTKEELHRAGQNPYVRVTEVSVDVRNRYQTAVVLSNLIQVNMFQNAMADQKGPPQDKIQALWDRIFVVPDFVNECTYGDTDFLKIQYVSGLPPAHDTQSGGLFASIRFRLWFARRA